MAGTTNVDTDMSTEYKLGQIVYLLTDEDQLPRMVTGITIRPGGTNIYHLSMSGEETSHYSIEISPDKYDNLRHTK